LGTCDDIFVLPHADPTWKLHGNLLDWNNTYKGAIWLGCHAGSVLSNIYNPDDVDQQMNFLMTKITAVNSVNQQYIAPVAGKAQSAQNSLISYQHHSGGTQPYLTNTDAAGTHTLASGTLAAPDDWVSQYIGTSDAAQLNGSEQIYLPVMGGGWLPSTKIITWDPDQSDVVGDKNGQKITSPGPAVLIAYGRAFGDNNRGLVMMEAGHQIYGAATADPNKGVLASPSVAADRAFLNWSYWAIADKAPKISNLNINSHATPQQYNSADFSLTYASPINSPLANVQWSCIYKDDGTSAGTFSPNNSATETSTTFTPNAVANNRQVVFTVVVTDACGRFDVDEWASTAIVGNVFDDANGLTDGKINGTGTNISGALNVVLYNQTTGLVAAVVPVAADGSYTVIPQAGSGNYTLMLTTEKPAIGTAAPTTSVLPSGWKNTGESATTASANDGSVDGKVSINLEEPSITTYFGIDQAPVANTTMVPLTQTPPANTVLKLDGTTDQLPVMSGTDGEDGTYTGGTGSINNPQGVVIASLPTGGTLLYNGVAVTQSDITSQVKFVDPTLFSIELTGSDYTSIAFSYAYADAAGIVGNPANYSVSLPYGLPIKFVPGSFKAIQSANNVVVSWATASEIDNAGFEVERSTDGKAFSKIGYVVTKSLNGNSNLQLDYNFTDKSPVPGVDNYYRLKQVDNDGSYTYSSVVLTHIGQSVLFNVYPNPAGDYINVGNAAIGNTLRIIGMDGKVYRATEVTTNPQKVSLSNIPSGLYFVQIVKENIVMESVKFVKQ